MGMKQFEEVVKRCDLMVLQLEKLAFSKNVALALKLAGGVEALIDVLDISADHWNKRVKEALLNVAKDAPVAKEMGVDNIPTDMLSATSVQLLGDQKPTGEEAPPPPSM